MSSAILVNLFEYRTGLWLPKAYVVGTDAGGHPRTVHQTATAGSLAGYAIEADGPLRRMLQLTEELRDKALAERFRKGARKVPTLAGLIREGSKERESVLRYVHARTSEVLFLSRQEGYFVTANLDTRSSPYAHLLAFEPRPWAALLSFELSETGMSYRLRLQDPADEVHSVRHLDPRVITNRPSPGWLLIGSRLMQVSGMRGDALRPFLSRDEVRIPPEEVGRYFREFIARAARVQRISVKGFDLEEIDAPTALRLSARPHPFDGQYYLYPEFRYGELSFTLDDPEPVSVTHTSAPPYRLTRAVRDATAEHGLLELLHDFGLDPVPVTGAVSVSPRPGPFENLAWLLRHTDALLAAGVEIVAPRQDGQLYVRWEPELELSVAEQGDWLDLKGEVTAGPHRIPFVRIVRYLQRGERRFPLPDGGVLLLPEAWFMTYGPALEMARLEGDRVKMARSQAPLLERAGVTVAVPVAAEPLANAYHPGASLRATLRPYQLDGARWLVRHYHERLGACLADDMGLGKTLQTIAVLLYAKEQLGQDQTAAAPRQIDLFAPAAEDESFLRPLRALVVLPASLVFNWASELQKFAPSLQVLANVGSNRIRDPRVLGRHDVLLTTYQTALRDQEILSQLDLEYIVLDESQQIKNRQSKVFRALNALEARHRISLSGTPIENSLSDLWSQMQFINPGLLGGFAFFKKSFITPIEQHDDARKKDQLRQLVGPYLLRRTKSEVAPDLPDLDVQVFYCEMTAAQRRRYEQERSAARNALLGTATAESGQYKLLVIQALTRLRQIANHPVIADAEYDKDSGKFAEAIEQWDTVRRSGQKVLIFSSMVRHLELFRDHLRKLNQPFAWITGGVPADQRAVEVERFQTDPAVQTFLISIKAGGTGLNLTAADYVFLLDPWWNPTTEDQAIARAHRIGRSGNVFARKFLTKDTLEEKIHRLQQRKKRLAEEVIDGRGGMEFDAEELEFILT